MNILSFLPPNKKCRQLCFLLLLLLGCGGQSFAQRANGVYLEVGGAAGHYSLNYERVLSWYGDSRLYGSVGFSPGLLNDPGFSPRIPVQFRFCISAVKGTDIEIGGGITAAWFISRQGGYSSHTGFYSFEKREFNTFWSGRIGVRHVLSSRAYLGCYYVPVFEEVYEGKPVKHWGAVTIGFQF